MYSLSIHFLSVFEQTNRSLAIRIAQQERKQYEPVPLQKNSSNRKRVIHLHVHNSAGTYMCHFALQNHELAKAIPGDAEKDTNCLPLIDNDGPWWSPRKHNYTCADREAQMQEKGITFAAIERYIDFDSGDWCPNQFLYTIILRDPIKRAISTIKHHESMSQITNYFAQGKEKGLDATQPWLSAWPAYSDLLVRSLNGPDAMKLPLGALQTSHLQIAKQRLREFHVVLAEPTLATDYVQLVDILGWNSSLPMESKINLQTYTKQVANDEIKALLEQHNYWDKQLYEYGLQLAKERSDVLIQQCKYTNYCHEK